MQRDRFVVLAFIDGDYTKARLYSAHPTSQKAIAAAKALSVSRIAMPVAVMEYDTDTVIWHQEEQIMLVHSVNFVRLSDILARLNVSDLHNFGDPFDGVSYGDAHHTLMPLPWVISTLEGFLDTEIPIRGGWGGMMTDIFTEIVEHAALVDMEN